MEGGKMIKIIIFFFITLILYSENISIVIYGDENYPPYSYVEKGILKGIYTEIIKEAKKEIEGYDIELRPIPWRRGLNLIESGGAFALYSPYYRPLERPWMDYSIPILEESLVIFANKQLIYEDTNWIELLKNLKIGKNSGFASLSALEKLIDVRMLDIEEANSTRMNLLKLGSGRIDAYINDKISILWTLKELKEKGEYKPSFNEIQFSPHISIEYGHIGYTTENDSIFFYKNDFKKKMDNIIQAMKEDGRIEAITFKYIDYSF
jgi:polar amino acid transport system substrate-binding protein